MSKNNELKKNVLLGKLSDGSNDFAVLGYTVWWNIRNVHLTKEEFVKHLEECGIDKKYARQHNFRSAFTRAIRSMEEDRIIRLVEEDHLRASYQFTAEQKVQGDNGNELRYDKETLIVVDKPKYRETGIFSEAVGCDQKYKDVIVELFNVHKNLYKSSDISRYLQVIFREQGDIISLRPQGSIYFVPVGYKTLIESVANLLGKIGNCKLEFMPVPNVETAREAIRASLIEELDGEFKSVEEDVEKVLSGDKGVSKVWSATRIERIKKMIDRIESYNEGGIVLDMPKYKTSAEDLQKKILGVRRLDIDEDGDGENNTNGAN